jgi:hypothetical protein
MVFFLWGHIKALIYTSPVDSDEDLIGCIVEAAATTGQQPGISEHNLCCATVGCVPTSAAVRFNICSKLVQNTTFFP